ncbi:MAG: hypothetical protein V9E85_11565 [Candidatus Nanopelagicales bacterium]
MADLGFKIHYRARKFLLHLYGPAELDGAQDPRVRLEAARDARLGPRTPKPARVQKPAQAQIHPTPLISAETPTNARTAAHTQPHRPPAQIHQPHRLNQLHRARALNH